jgi:hypothetical protein
MRQVGEANVLGQKSGKSYQSHILDFSKSAVWRWGRAWSFFVLAVTLTACATPVTITNPCGVIIDSLRDVHGKDGFERRRIDRHFEAGVAAGCWKRT